MSPFHAVIIAGGKGERLGGVRKADLLVGGRRLVDRVADAIGEVESPLMIAVGPRDDGRGARACSIAVTDIDASLGGPLAGLAAAVESLGTRGITRGLLASAAVDGPFLPADFVARLMACLDEAPAAFAAWDQQFYPPNALWRLQSIADLPARVRAGTAPSSLKTLLQELGAQPVDWRKFMKSNPFLNINTLGDVVALGKNAASRT